MGSIKSGICRGGPLSGLPLHHHEDRYFKFKRDGKIITYTMPPGGAKELPPDIQVGVYEWDGDQWQWSREVD